MNENHLRVINSSFRLIEEELRLLRYELIQDPMSQKTIFYNVAYDLSRNRKKKVLGKIEALLEELKRIGAELGLEVVEVNLSKRIMIVESQIWVLLEELEPKRLRGYGDLSDKEAEKFHQQIQNLVRMASLN